MKFHRLAIFFLLIFLAACGPSGTQTTQPTSASAYIENKGSDTIVNLALSNGYVSITPLQLDLTMYSAIPTLGDWDWAGSEGNEDPPVTKNL